MQCHCHAYFRALYASKDTCRTDSFPCRHSKCCDLKACRLQFLQHSHNTASDAYSIKLQNAGWSWSTVALCNTRQLKCLLRVIATEQTCDVVNQLMLAAFRPRAQAHWSRVPQHGRAGGAPSCRWGPCCPTAAVPDR